MKQLMIMSIIVGAGIVFAKFFKVSDEQQKFLSKLLLYFVNPCLVVSSFNIDFDLEKLKQLLIVVCIAFFIHCVMIFIAFCGTFSKKDIFNDYKIIEKVGIIFTNCGFIGIPLIRGVFGEEGVFYLMGYLVVFNIFLWTYGYYQMSGTINLKKIFLNPNIIAVCLGLIIFCMPFKLPEFISKPIDMISDMNTATSMVLLGILLANLKFPESNEAFSRKYYVFRIGKFVFFRLVVCAIINIVISFFAYKIFSSIPDIRMMIFVVLICSMCPSATSVPSLSCIFEKDQSYASIIVSITSIVCIITTPTFVALAERIIQ